MKRGEDGFVMADALVALLIATLFATGLLSANRLTMDASRQAHDRLTAAYLARAVLIQSDDLREGHVSVGGTEFDWQKVLEERSSQIDGPAQLTDIDVGVSWQGKQRDQSIAIHTTRMRGQ